MRTTTWSMALLLAVTPAARGGAQLVGSLDDAGRLIFNELPRPVEYTVEWAPAPDGPWTNTWGTLTSIPAGGGSSITCSVPVYYRVTALVTNPTPENMVLIPAGSFQRGDVSNDYPGNDEHPVQSVSVSAFYMDKYEVTKSLWDSVKSYATTYGYTFSNTGFGKAPTHPVGDVNWYDCVKWCNLRSEIEGLQRVYYRTSAKTNFYKAGLVDLTNDCADWGANGYRLLTEAEWEKAARAVYADSRFPWGDQVNHDWANYRANGDALLYDNSPYTTFTYHPGYLAGGHPYTCPVSAFSGHGGVYHMSGNVIEWCWDWYQSTWYHDPNSGMNDTRGPGGIASHRVLRGGAYNNSAVFLRCSDRHSLEPLSDYVNIGFRCARGL